MWRVDYISGERDVGRVSSITRSDMSPAGYSVSIVCIIGQFLKVDSTLLEARTAGGPMEKICSYVLCYYGMQRVLLVRFSQYNVHI